MTAVTARRYAWEELPKDFPMPMLDRRRIIGEKMMLSQVHLDKGCVVPTHSHENEQFCCVLSGALSFEIGPAGAEGNEFIVCRAGDVIHLPSHVPHAAEAIEETLVIDLFSPPSATTGIDRA